MKGGETACNPASGDTELHAPMGNIDYVEGVSFRNKKYPYKYITVSGWVLNRPKGVVAKGVRVCLNGISYEAEYGFPRDDIAYSWSKPQLRLCGFSFSVRTADVPVGEYVVSVQAIDDRGDCLCEIMHPSKLVVSNSFLDSVLLQSIMILRRVTGVISRMYRGFVLEKWFLFSLIKNIFVLLWFCGREEKLVVINLEERIGDIVACEPVSRIMRDENPHAYIIWVTKYRYGDLVRYNPAINLVLGVTCIFEWALLKKLNLPIRIVDLHTDEKLCTSFIYKLENKNDYGVSLDNYYAHGNLLEAFLMSANIPGRDMAPLFHFKDKLQVDTPDNFIVVHCSSDEMYRNWDVDKWLTLSEWLMADGYHVAEIGLKNVIQSNNVAYRSYCNKLSLQESGYVIKKALLFIGIDSAFAHIANSVSTPGVILLGTYRNYNTYMPYSGEYRTGENATIIQYDGYAKDIPVELVYRLVKERMLRCSNRNRLDNLLDELL